MLVGMAALAILGWSAIGRARRGCWTLDRRHLRHGLIVLGVGLGTYVLVRLVNDGHAPSTADALRTAGRATVDASGRRVAELTDRRLGLLGDLVAWPAPFPLATVIGLPQILMLVGLAMSIRMPPASPDVTSIDLDSGRFWWDAAAGGGEHLEVRLPGGVLRANAARLGIDASATGAIVIVVEGAVTIEGRGPAVVVEEGHGVEIDPEGMVSEPERLSAKDLMADPWVGPHLADVGARRAPSARNDGPIWSVATVVAALALVGLAGVTYVAQIASVPSASMTPTLQEGDRVLVAKAVGAPAQRDVIVFERPPSMNEGPILLVKRVVAIGGQSVEVRDGRVLVDGRAIAEPYLAKGTETTEICDDRGIVEVPAGSLFVLGDNRPDSFDSRCFGPIRYDQVVGTVVRGVIPMSGTP